MRLGRFSLKKEKSMKLGRFTTNKELHDLGEFDPNWQGILSPLYDEDFVKKFIHGQFLENSATYVQKYQNFDHWKGLISAALNYLPYKTHERINILDIGSGSGNTIFPLMDLFPNSEIVATDLSLPLLRALKDYHEENYHSHTCYVVQLNAEDIIFKPNTIDLVVGGSILHHLFDPEKSLTECYKVLKPGGAAIFFEPFEIGNQIIAMLFKHLIQINDLINEENGKISPEITKFFNVICYDLEVRKGNNKENPQFQYMDDKWLFTRSYFENFKKTIGYKEIFVYPLYEREHQFLNQVKTLLRLGPGVDITTLPQWAMEKINETDELFSLELRDELILGGGVILKK